ncbi:MAG: 4'-phosphopantetheinyl transferase superfamily protein [Methylocystis sp.]
MISNRANADMPPASRREAVNTPILGRVFEVEAAAGLARIGVESAESEWPLSVNDFASAPLEARCADASDESPLAFLGPILNFVEGESITVERTLDLDEDLYLADHAFVLAPKPLSACLPVMPMTMSLEAMAETAACLAPGYGLLGFQDVKSTRWIDLADAERIALRIEAKVERQDPERGVIYVDTAIYTDQQDSPAISATVLFGDHYLAETSPLVSELANAYRYPLTGEQIYAERRMFHGPAFQCLSGEITIGDEGVQGELVVPASESLFRSTRRPQLLTQPALLDAVGQIIGLWAMEKERYAFPIGVTRLEILGPTPPVGVHVPVRVEITRNEGKTLAANVEIGDGAGGVWMRIADWRKWKFRWEKHLVDFRRFPDQYLLARRAPLPEIDREASCLMLSKDDLAQFDLTLLARYCLGVDEMATFWDLGRFPRRQTQWLLGRVAAKDAVRHWAVERTRAAMLHPAAFAINADERGRPFVEALPNGDTPPCISISHCEDRAIAIASKDAVGVDIERIATRDANLVKAFATANELGMLGEYPDDQRDAWLTRLWCAKEAVGKVLGFGIDGKAQSLEATHLSGDGTIDVLHRASDRSFRVTTVEDRGFIIARASESGTKV